MANQQHGTERVGFEPVQGPLIEVNLVAKATTELNGGEGYRGVPVE